MCSMSPEISKGAEHTHSPYVGSRATTKSTSRSGASLPAPTALAPPATSRTTGGDRAATGRPHIPQGRGSQRGAQAASSQYRDRFNMYMITCARGVCVFVRVCTHAPNHEDLPPEYFNALWPLHVIVVVFCLTMENKKVKKNKIITLNPSSSLGYLPGRVGTVLMLNP